MNIGTVVLGILPVEDLFILLLLISILLIGVNVKLLPHVEVPGEPVHAAGLCRLLGQQGNRQHQVTGDPDTLHNKNGDTNIDDRGIYF